MTLTNHPMRRTAPLTLMPDLLAIGLLVISLWLAGGGQPAHAGSPQLTMTHFPVFRRELMQSQLTLAYSDLDRKWGAPVTQLVLNSYCDNWRALHAKSYAVQAVPGHWLPRARQLGYSVLVGLTYDGAHTLLLTRAKTDEQLKSLITQQGIATPDRLSAVTSVGRQYLATQLGLADDRIKLAEMPYDDMPMLGLVQGNYQAVLTSPSVYTRMQSRLKQDIRVISIASPSVNAAFVVDPAQLADVDIVRLRTLMLDLNSKAQTYNFHYVTPDALMKSDLHEPAVDPSHCPLMQ